MIGLLQREKLLWSCMLCVLLAAVSVSHAAPPHPRLFLQQLERAMQPALYGMRADVLQFQDPDVPRQGYRVQPDGVEYILAILIDFSDQPGQKPISVFNDALFGVTGTSVKLYFEEVSYGHMRIRPGYLNGVVPQEGDWYRARNPMSYYGEGTGVVMSAKYAELVREACEAADGDVDFSRYDRDGDGYVDHVMLIHAGNDEAWSGMSADIWSGMIDNVSGVYDGVRISSAVVVAEDPNNDFINIGIYCHEFFHDFGAPDLYAWDHPVGHWGLMGYFGPYQDDGRHPSHISGYLKWDFNANPSDGIDGWLEPINLTSDGIYSVDSFEIPGGDRLYKIDIPGKLGKEYFLIENRNKLSGAIYDTYLPESGIVIWHIEESRSAYFGSPGRVWVEDPGDPDRSKLIRATEGAAYSADDDQTSFSPSTQPSSNDNSGEYSGIIVADIGQEGMTMSFTYSTDDTYEPNDSISDAYEILEYGREYSSYIREHGDVDFFRFHADENASIIVYLEDTPEGMDYDLQAFDPQGNLIDASTEEQQAGEIAGFRARTAGTYYISVSSETDYSSIHPYSLTVDSIPVGARAIADFVIYPNPGPAGNESISFDYRLLEPAENLTLDIYTIAGALAHSESRPSPDRIGRFLWNARATSGEMVASGIYVCVLKADLNGEIDIRTGKVAVVY